MAKGNGGNDYESIIRFTVEAQTAIVKINQVTREFLKVREAAGQLSDYATNGFGMVESTMEQLARKSAELEGAFHAASDPEDQKKIAAEMKKVSAAYTALAKEALNYYAAERKGGVEMIQALNMQQKAVENLHKARARTKKQLYDSAKTGVMSEGSESSVEAIKRLHTWANEERRVIKDLVDHEKVSRYDASQMRKVLNEQVARDEMRLNEQVAKNRSANQIVSIQNVAREARLRIADSGKVTETDNAALNSLIRRINAMEKLGDEERKLIRLIKMRNREGVQGAKIEQDVIDTLRKHSSAAEEAGGHFIRLAKSYGPLLVTLSRYRNMILLATFAVRPFLRLAIQSVNTYAEYERAITGVVSVGEKFGYTAMGINANLGRLANDGLFKVTDASKALRNLLSTGIGMDQAMRTLDALRNSAAFNRQGMLEYGEAIVGATDGIKNFISRMVDNAGITKNLSNILKEQSKQLGINTEMMTERQKMMIITTGIIKEAAIYEGDAARMAKTTSGELSRMTVSINKMSREFGGLLDDAKIVGAVTSSVTLLANGFGNLFAIMRGDSGRLLMERGAILGIEEETLRLLESGRVVNAMRDVNEALRERISLLERERLSGGGASIGAMGADGGFAVIGIPGRTRESSFAPSDEDAKNLANQWEQAAKVALNAFIAGFGDNNKIRSASENFRREQSRIITESRKLWNQYAQDQIQSGSDSFAVIGNVANRLETLNDFMREHTELVAELERQSKIGGMAGGVGQNINYSELQKILDQIESARYGYTDTKLESQRRNLDKTIESFKEAIKSQGLNLFSEEFNNDEMVLKLRAALEQMIEAGMRKIEIDHAAEILKGKISIMSGELQKSLKSAVELSARGMFPESVLNRLIDNNARIVGASKEQIERLINSELDKVREVYTERMVMALDITDEAERENKIKSIGAELNIELSRTRAEIESAANKDIIAGQEKIIGNIQKQYELEQKIRDARANHSNVLRQVGAMYGNTQNAQGMLNGEIGRLMDIRSRQITNARDEHGAGTAEFKRALGEIEAQYEEAVASVWKRLLEQGMEGLGRSESLAQLSYDNARRQSSLAQLQKELSGKEKRFGNQLAGSSQYGNESKLLEDLYREKSNRVKVDFAADDAMLKGKLREIDQEYQKESYELRIEYLDKFIADYEAKWNWVDNASTVAQAWSNAFNEVGRAIKIFGGDVDKELSRIQAGMDGMIAIMKGAQMMAIGGPVGTMTGLASIVGGIAGFAGGVFGRGDAEEGKAARRNRTFGTTVSRGPTHYTLAPSIVLENSGDVNFSTDGIEVATQNMAAKLQQLVDYGELSVN